jgi:hypothetical protein
LSDTGIFASGQYCDITVEYAKESPEDILIQLSVTNRGEDVALVHVLPTLWFRNQWSGQAAIPKPRVKWMGDRDGISVISASHPELGNRYLYCEGASVLLFTENESSGTASPYLKDSIDTCVVQDVPEAVNPAMQGTKVAVHYQVMVAADETRTVRLRLTEVSPTWLRQVYVETDGDPFGFTFDRTLVARRVEADAFYTTITPATLGQDARLVMRQALATTLWSKQYRAESKQVFSGSQATPLQLNRVTEPIVAVPDKWQTPRFDTWNPLFQVMSLALVDIQFAKRQLSLMLQAPYMDAAGHFASLPEQPDRPLPPLHAWAVKELYELERDRFGKPDVAFLRYAFHRLLLNYNAWMNRRDSAGLTVLEGGFLGIDSLGGLDPAAEWANGAVWMAFFNSQLLVMALELSLHDPVYQDLACKFYEEFVQLAALIYQQQWLGEDGLWCDRVRMPGESAQSVPVHSFISLLPLCACTVITPEMLDRLALVRELVQQCDRHYPELMATIANGGKPGVAGRRVLSLLGEPQLQRLLGILLDEQEFLSPFGVRSLSYVHHDQPVTLTMANQSVAIAYQPGAVAAGYSLRGAIWFPQNFLLIRALNAQHAYYGQDWQVPCPTYSSQLANLWQVSQTLTNRLVQIFLEKEGVRPVFGAAKLFREANWQETLLFYEYFDGETGKGLGSSHHAAWTGLVAWLIQFYGYVSGESFIPPMSSASVQ